MDALALITKLRRAQRCPCLPCRTKSRNNFGTRNRPLHVRTCGISGVVVRFSRLGIANQSVAGIWDSGEFMTGEFRLSRFVGHHAQLLGQSNCADGGGAVVQQAFGTARPRRYKRQSWSVVVCFGVSVRERWPAASCATALARSPRAEAASTSPTAPTKPRPTGSSSACPMPFSRTVAFG